MNATKAATRTDQLHESQSRRWSAPTQAKPVEGGRPKGSWLEREVVEEVEVEKKRESDVS